MTDGGAGAVLTRRTDAVYRPAGTVYLMATDTRQRILAALRDILAAGGNTSVTLEAVAAKAGVSKGGLLYHFPSKAAMYLGLLAAVRDTVTTDMAEVAGRSGAARGFLEYAVPTAPDEADFFTSLIAAVRTGQESESAEVDAQAAELMVDIFRAWEAPMRGAVTDPLQAEQIRLIGFGLYFSALVGLPQPDPALLAALFDRVLAR